MVSSHFISACSIILHSFSHLLAVVSFRTTSQILLQTCLNVSSPGMNASNKEWLVECIPLSFGAEMDGYSND